MKNVSVKSRPKAKEALMRCFLEIVIFSPPLSLVGLLLHLWLF
ncbi:hypothetical protein EMIT074MI3_10235 [Bacillus licheniformis]